MSQAVVQAAPLDLGGRVALVTGGGGGIGAAVVATLLRAGARVASADLSGRQGPSGCTDLPVDLSRGEEAESLVGRTVEALGRMDVLVHAAGIARDATLWRLERPDWDAVLEVNLTSAFHLLRAAAPVLRAQGGGTIVLVSSINGQRGKRGQAAYAASKAGLEALGKTAAIELAPSNVRVNVVAPGWIDTAMTASLPADIRERAVEESLLKRAGRPEDVALAVLFLATDMSRHVTGQVLRVDGGQLTA